MITDFPLEVIDNELRICHFTSNHLTKRYVNWLNDPEVVRFSEQRHFNHTFKSCSNYYLNQLKTDNLFLAIMLGITRKILSFLFFLQPMTISNFFFI